MSAPIGGQKKLSDLDRKQLHTKSLSSNKVRQEFSSANTHVLVGGNTLVQYGVDFPSRLPNEFTSRNKKVDVCRSPKRNEVYEKHDDAFKQQSTFQKPSVKNSSFRPPSYKFKSAPDDSIKSEIDSEMCDKLPEVKSRVTAEYFPDLKKVNDTTTTTIEIQKPYLQGASSPAKVRSSFTSEKQQHESIEPKGAKTACVSKEVMSSALFKEARSAYLSSEAKSLGLFKEAKTAGLAKGVKLVGLNDDYSKNKRKQSVAKLPKAKKRGPKFHPKANRVFSDVVLLEW